MASPADQRLLDLLEKWLKSLELHAKYSTLDDDSYWKIQTWVKHQRPSRWIIDLAMQKTLALRAQVQERMAAGDEKYSDSLELMIFLANLVGVEHIERFIPVADAENEHSLATGATPEPSAEDPPGDSAPAADAATGTREMPRFSAVKRGPPPAGTTQVARSERKPPAPAKPPAKKPAAPLKPQPKAAKAPSEGAGISDGAREQVMADAARLVQWGRKWYELPELIARMAGRPSLPDVRRILKENKAAIDRLAGNA
jgi:hypothetical protein